MENKIICNVCKIKYTKTGLCKSCSFKKYIALNNDRMKISPQKFYSF